VAFTQLKLQQNSLNGSFPASGWDRIVYSSSEVDLSSNALKGPLPSSWLAANATYAPSLPALAALNLRWILL
jgi:hypothetical protein